MAPLRRGRAAPLAPTIDQLEAMIATESHALHRQAEHAAMRVALATGDPATVRAWADEWGVPLLPCSDELLLESMAEAARLDAANAVEARLHSIDDAARAVAAQIVAQPPRSRERLIAALATSEDADPLRREFDRTIALHARRLLGGEEVLTA